MKTTIQMLEGEDIVVINVEMLNGDTFKFRVLNEGSDVPPKIYVTGPTAIHETNVVVNGRTVQERVSTLFAQRAKEELSDAKHITIHNLDLRVDEVSKETLDRLMFGSRVTLHSLFTGEKEEKEGKEDK
jgi:hypothetical protein